MPTLYDRYVRPAPKSNSIDNNYDRLGADLKTIADNIAKKSVLQFLLFPAFYEQPNGDSSLLVSMLTQFEAVQPPLAGIIFESYGDGNIPDYQRTQTLLPRMRHKDTDEKILVDCTQVFADDANYNAYATGAWLKKGGGP